MFFAWANSQELEGTLTKSLNSYGIPALFLVGIILESTPQFISPVVALATGILAGMNIYLAILVTVLGSIIGSLVGFFLGERYMLSAVELMVPKKDMNKLDYLMNKYGKIIIPITAITPLPYFPIFFGAMKMSWRNFIIYGMVPRAIGILAWGIFIYLI